MGKRNLDCTPWGMPAYSIFGWQKPCYLCRTAMPIPTRNCWIRPIGEVRLRIGQSQMRQLHAALGLRGLGGGLHVYAEGRFRHYARDALFPLSRCRAPSDRSERPQSPLVQIEARRALTAQAVRWPSPAEIPADALEEAFDYRGDVTVALQYGERVEGYIFDRDPGARLRIMTRPGRADHQYSELARLHRTRYGRRAQLGSLGKEVRRGRPRAKTISSSFPKPSTRRRYDICL